MGTRLDLEHPATFTEKLQYLKLYARDPAYTRMVDKVSVKAIVAEKIGQEHVIPTLGVWNSASDIDFSKLPDEFVLKVSHDSGGIVICKEKSSLNLDEARKKIDKALKFDYFRYSREWPYKNVKRLVFAEKYMKDSSSEDLVDYKFYCFNGEPRFLYFSRNEHKPNEEITFYTMDWKKAPFQRSDHRMVSDEPEKPSTFDEMVRIARILSEGIPFVRVDLYAIEGRVYFGEYSFFPTSGLFKLSPKDWDRRIGDMLDISSIERNYK